eukprot:jgi/Picsp_1/2954/NSC_01178-R1_metal ion transporter family
MQQQVCSRYPANRTWFANRVHHRVGPKALHGILKSKAKFHVGYGSGVGRVGRLKWVSRERFLGKNVRGSSRLEREYIDPPISANEQEDDRMESSKLFLASEYSNILKALQAHKGGPQHGPGANDTFKQLRQAVLSSLDFSEDGVETSHDLEEFEHWEDVGPEAQGSAAAVGKAMYEALRIDSAGKSRRVYLRRRDLIRRHNLQPRDLRRMDPSLSPTKTSPTITVKEDCILINIGGIRAIITADRCLLFEPYSSSSKKFVEIVCPRLLSSGVGKNQEARDRIINAIDSEREALLLVELESKSANIQELIEEIMDDDDEIRELNLSSRPIREEKRRQRERDRLEREMEREWAEREMRYDEADKSPNGSMLHEPDGGTESASESSPVSRDAMSWKEWGDESRTSRINLPGSRNLARRDRDGEDGEDAFQAQDALEELIEEEEEERELEETEDLLEYYLQRAAMTQSEAERLLAGARDLEESISVSLSARRFEVNRLELLLSIASFAAALGAMIASIFGMNLRSTLEMSVVGFWGTTGMIVAGSIWVFWVLYKYTKRKRIL